MEKMSKFFQSSTLMKLPEKKEVVVVKPEAVESVDLDRALRRKEYVEKKKSWWRCENPGCTAAFKNKYSQRKGIMITSFPW